MYKSHVCVLPIYIFLFVFRKYEKNLFLYLKDNIFIENKSIFHFKF